LVASVDANNTHSTSALFDNNTQSISAVCDNITQCTFTLVNNNTQPFGATTTELASALTHNAQPVALDENISQSTASLLTFAQAVRNTNVPSFLCQIQCILPNYTLILTGY
jgi:hypothetical protein